MTLYSILTISLTLLAAQCAKESEENQFYKQQKLDDFAYDEGNVSKEQAIENWETVLQETQDLIFYSRNNLESFRYQIDRKSGVERFDLLKAYERYAKDIENLEWSRTKRNDAFYEELNRYDQSSYQRNKDFRKKFKREIVRINLALGCSTEDQLEYYQ